MKIEIAGPGCPRCKATEKNVEEAVKELGIDAEVTKLTNVAEFAEKGVMFTPAIIIDGKVRLSGRIPTVDEIKEVLSSS